MLINNPEARRTFIFGGKAIFTLKSKRTGIRFTYKVSSNKEGAIYFVSVLSGPDNTSDYTYAGIIFADNLTHIKYTQKSRISMGAPSMIALQWFLIHIETNMVEFYHEGKCCRCARRLTDPESIKNGIGPECSRRMAA